MSEPQPTYLDDFSFANLEAKRFVNTCVAIKYLRKEESKAVSISACELHRLIQVSLQRKHSGKKNVHY